MTARPKPDPRYYDGGNNPAIPRTAVEVNQPLGQFATALRRHLLDREGLVLMARRLDPVDVRAVAFVTANSRFIQEQATAWVAAFMAEVVG